jgi:hypothetical protein
LNGNFTRPQNPAEVTHIPQLSFQNIYRSFLPKATEAHPAPTMATIRPMRPADLLLISSTNLDHLTETYNISFYMEYLTKWPELCQVIEGIDGKIEGYSTLAAANAHRYLAKY